MKATINTTENIFRQPMTFIGNTSASTRAFEYFIAAEQELYRELSKDEMRSFLCSAASIQHESGLLPLMLDPQMPWEARVDMHYRPSYAVAAVAVYAYQKWPELFGGELGNFIHALLEGTFARGIAGHGFEAQETIRRTLMALCKAGAREFVETNGERFPMFCEMMRRYMADMEHLALRIDKEGIKCTEGFSTESVNTYIKALVAIWHGKRYPVFVYGTLMKEQRAAYMLEGSTYVGDFLLKDYGMYNLGRYPGIKPCKGESVYGEVYFVDEHTRQRLDEYEGEGSLYDRTKVCVVAGNLSMETEAYVYCGTVNKGDLMRQPWNAKDDDMVWYAGYGSNLSSKRFECYISGGTCEENGRSYVGARDKSPAKETKNKSYPGYLYFGNSSSSWGGGGVAFYDPNGCSPHAIKGWEDSYNSVYMRLYKITRAQLEDVMDQEGRSPNWYGRLICLEVDDEGVPVYTLTSETRRPENTPNEAYSNLIINALKTEFRMGIRDSKGYVKKWQPK